MSAQVRTRLMMLLTTAAIAAFAGLSPRNASAAEPSPPQLYRANFQLFDALISKGKPDLTQYGLKPTHIVYEVSLFPDKSPATVIPTDDALQRVATAAQSWPGLLILDVERWIGLPDQTERYVDFTKRLKVLMPDRPLGHYSVVPVRDYWRAREPHGSAKYLAWQSENDALQPVADAVNIVYPSLYTFYDNQSGWVAYAVENMREARRLAKGKPVYAFIWPAYHESNLALRGQPIPGDYWRLQLETVLKYADGAVIWGGGQWDPDAAWWHETLAFIERRKEQTGK